MSPRRTVFGAVAALALVCAAPAAAQSDDIIAPGPDGTATFAYLKGSSPQTVRERSWSASSILTPGQVVSWADFPAEQRRVGVDAAGNALIAWIGYQDAEQRAVLIRRRGPDGSLGPIQPLTPPGVDPAYLALDVEPDGDATVAWTRQYGDGRVAQSRRRNANGTLGATKTLSGTLGFAQNTAVAVTPSGAATVAWLRVDSEASSYVQTRTVAADGTLSAIQRLTPISSSAGAPTVGVGDQGTAVFSWIRVFALETRARSAGGTLSPTQMVSAEPRSPHAAGDPSGRAAFVWLEPETDVVKGRIRAPNGVLGPVFDIADFGSAPRVALDANGHATFAWTEVFKAQNVIRARRRTAAGSLGPVRLITDDTTSSTLERVAVDGAGKATLAFQVQLGAPAGLYARTLSPTGALGPSRQIDGP